MVEQGASLAPVIISAVGAFGGGALVGAIAGHWLRVGREHRQERQERQSLLFLVLVEMLSNDTTARRWARPLEMAEERGELPNAEAATLRTEVWEDARIRLAYLVPPRDFYPLIRHYNSIHRWRSKPEEETLHYYRDALRPRIEVAVRLIAEYLNEEIAEGFIREYEEELKRFGQGQGSTPEEAP